MPHYYTKGDNFKSPKFKKILGILLMLSGLGIAFYFLFPILSLHFFLSGYASGDIESPIPKNMITRGKGEIRDLVVQGINSLTHDYTDARNWYPQISSSIQSKTKVETYRLSIPKLKIEDAEVSTKDYDLDRHLIQYLGTAIPGEKGTAIIFGHSTLPGLFNANNYKTIFANAHKLKIGDDFFADVNGVIYKYKIFSIVVTTPDDTNILSQNFDNSYVTLVTCTPPGTIWKRLVIRATLADLEKPV